VEAGAAALPEELPHGDDEVFKVRTRADAHVILKSSDSGVAVGLFMHMCARGRYACVRVCAFLCVSIRVCVRTCVCLKETESLAGYPTNVQPKRNAVDIRADGAGQRSAYGPRPPEGPRPWANGRG
jgi:hypothetical protein